jgi:hypothetical protein
VRTGRLAALGFLVLCAPGLSRSASAQLPSTDPPPPPAGPILVLKPDGLHGLAVTVGVGGARRKLYCGGCSQGVGLSGLINVSRFVGRKTAIGLEGTGWFKDAGPVSASLWSGMGAVTTWLADRVPLFLTGGFGFVVYHQADASYGSSTTDTGFGCSGRIGYDAHLSQAIALVPYVGYINTIEHVKVGRASQVVGSLQFGLGLRLR